MLMLQRTFLKTRSVCVNCLLLLQRSVHRSPYNGQYVSLQEVGRLEPPQHNGCYSPGQFFLHRVLGYRGVVVFPWTVNVYDRDISERCLEFDEDGPPTPHTTLKAQKQSYYQALVDNDDFPYVRTHPDAITFLASDTDKSLYSLPGLDYVSHDDILPYTSTGLEHFTHQLFNQFFAPTGETKGPLYLPRDLLTAWTERNQGWLGVAEVHRETTGGVRVSVLPLFLGSNKDKEGAMKYWWRYTIRLECLSGERLILRKRQWRIHSTSGRLETVNGQGVVGEEPVFSTTQPCFQYSSQVSLDCPSGNMWGVFVMERVDKSLFEVRIPSFSLNAPSTDIKEQTEEQ